MQHNLDKSENEYVQIKNAPPKKRIKNATSIVVTQIEFFTTLQSKK